MKKPLKYIFLLIIFFSLLIFVNTGSHGYGAREGNSSITFSPDSKLLALGSGSRSYVIPELVIDNNSGKIKEIIYDNTPTIKLIDIETGRIRNIFNIEGDITDISFSPNGQYLTASCTLPFKRTSVIIRVWDVKKNKIIKELETPAIFFMKFINNQTIVYNYFNELYEWNIKSKRAMKSDLKPKDITHSSDQKGRLQAFNKKKESIAYTTKSVNSSITIKDMKTNVNTVFKLQFFTGVKLHTPGKKLLEVNDSYFHSIFHTVGISFKANHMRMM